jgi:integrase
MDCINIDFGNLEDSLIGLPKWKLGEISKAITTIRESKYKRRTDPKYGNLSKSMSKEQLFEIFKIISPQIRSFFLVQLFYGLRIGEIKSIEIKEEINLIKFWNDKYDRIEYLPIHGPTLQILKEAKHCSINSTDRLRNRFREEISKLNYIYAKSTNGKKLNLYTTHSLRHSAITLFTECTNSELKAFKFGRWKKGSRKYGCLPIYYDYTMDRMRIDLEKTFSEYYNLIDTT